MQDVAIRNGAYWSFLNFNLFEFMHLALAACSLSVHASHDLGVASGILYRLSYRNVFIFMKYITYTLYFDFKFRNWIVILKEFSILNAAWPWQIALAVSLMILIYIEKSCVCALCVFNTVVTI